MTEKKGHPEKRASANPSPLLADGAVPQIRESETIDTNPNQDETQVASGQSPVIVQQRAAVPLVPKSPTDLRGSVIAGKYAIEEKLGEGGMGSVYQAYDAMMKRVVAIKLLNQDREISDESWKRFQQEAHATSQLDHPNIVRIHDFHVCDTHGPYLVMDMINGEPLNSLIARKGPLDPQFVADIMIQVADALQHAHEKGIVHRDLKPSNILVSSEVGKAPSASVVDFGIAKLQGENLDDLKLTKTGEVFGSPLYMSPEQCLASGLDKRSDIYSLGCVMYEALCGEPPFKGKNFGETVIKHTKEAPKPFAAALNIPSAIKRIVFCALEKSPADRYQSMAALKKELLNFKRGQFVRVKQKRRFWKIAIVTCLATIPISAFFCLRDAVKDQPEFISTVFMQYHVPEIVEWFILPDDETREALHAVKIAMRDYKQGHYQQAENVLKGIIEANPDSNRFRRLTAWPLARALARQGKYQEAESYLRKTYTSSDWQVGHNLQFVGTTLKLHDGCSVSSRYFFERSRDFFIKAKDLNDAARSTYFLATCQLDAEEYAEAKKNFQSALSVLEKSPAENSVWIKNCQDGLKRISLDEPK